METAVPYTTFVAIIEGVAFVEFDIGYGGANVGVGGGLLVSLIPEGTRVLA